MKWLLALVLVLVAAPAAARPVVLTAAGGVAFSHPPGSEVDDNGTLVLKPGDRLHLITAAGRLDLAGPRTVQLEPRPAVPPEAAALLALPDPAALAALAPAADGLWLHDIRTSTTICVIDRLGIALWRADAAAPLSLQMLRRGVPTRLDFAAGQPVVLVPPSVPVSDGDVLTLHGQAAPVTLTVRIIRRPRRLDGLAGAFVRMGCHDQFARLGRLAPPVPDPVAGLPRAD